MGRDSPTTAMRPPLTVLVMTFALVVVAHQKSDSTDSQRSLQQTAHDEYERHKQAAIHINDLAGRIHSEADADIFVSEIRVLFDKELPPVWADGAILHRIAHSEYEAASQPAKLIPERRIVDVWNKYVREVGASDEAVVTTAEIHNMRDGEFTVAQLMWAKGNQTIWTMPNVYALGPDGKVADGCRAVEALRVIHNLDGLFQNLRGARDRVRRGIVASEEIKKRADEVNPRPQATARLVVHAERNPIRLAEARYVQERGTRAYEQMLKRLFDELFPSE